MASKLSKLKVKGQRSVPNLVKSKEVTDLHSDDNNSDILSENESERQLAKVTKILLRRNKHHFTELRNDMSTLIRNAEILQEQQSQIELLKRENSEMQLRCTKLETDQHRLRNK